MGFHRPRYSHKRPGTATSKLVDIVLFGLAAIHIAGFTYAICYFAADALTRSG